MKTNRIARFARPATVALALLTGSLAGAVPTAFMMDATGSYAPSDRLQVGAGSSSSVSFSLRAGAVGKTAEAARLPLGGSASASGLAIEALDLPAGIGLSLGGATAWRTSEGEPLVRFDAILAAGPVVPQGTYPIEFTVRNTLTGETAVVAATVQVGANPNAGEATRDSE